ncbi:MAG: SET domain-containing protein [Patescibacteria group bacterium]|nr:SET domain-containing protein [Patescibacteria group bacterium]MDE2438006.1 SET domain-containing protein [Patescibacteria group bacterium]
MSGEKKVEIRASRIAGRGVFALAVIRQGETIFEPCVRVVHTRSRYTQANARTGQHMLAVGPRRWIGTARNDPLWNLNHSCAPNACIRNVSTCVALRKIQPGEEITIDYTLTEEDEYWEMSPCRCRSRKCRHVIISLPLMPQDFRRRHRSHVANWLKLYTLV